MLLSIILLIIFSIISLILIFDLTIILFNSKLLLKNQFKFDKIIENNENLGWIQKNNFSFNYYHRYNKYSKPINIHLNNYGIPDKLNYYSKDNKNFKIAIFGDNSYSDYDYNYNNSFIKNLRSHFKEFKDLSIYNFTQRDYSTIQYYNLIKILNEEFKFNLILYIFSFNHPRKNITIHEAGKDLIFTHPANQLLNNSLIKKQFLNSKNDLIYIDEKNNIQKKSKSKKRHILHYFYNNFYSFSFFLDKYKGPLGMKKQKHIFEIKNIEKKSLKKQKINQTYHWKIFNNIILNFVNNSRDKNYKFILMYQPSPYDILSKYYNSEHPLGYLDKKSIPFFKNLDNLKSKTKFDFYNLTCKELESNYKKYYIHDRYMYLNKCGYKLQSAKIAKILKNHYL